MVVEQPLLFPLIATVSPKLHKMYISSVIAMVAPKLDGFVILVVMNMLCYPNFFFCNDVRHMLFVDLSLLWRGCVA